MTKLVHKVPVHILDAFHNLVKSNVEKQTETSLTILKFMNSEIQSSKGNASESNEARYIINRLVSGLESSRESARQGYFITLESLLHLHPGLVNTVVEIVDKKRSDASQGSNDEVRNQLIGELMVHGALVRAGCVYKDSKLCAQTIARFVEIGKMKQYMDLIATHFIVDLINNDKRGNASNEVLKQLRSSLSTSLSECSPNIVWIKITLINKMALLDDPPLWLTDTLSHHNYAILMKVFMKCSEAPEKTIHPVIRTALSTFENLQKEKKTRPVIKFWKNGVSLFLSEQSTFTMKLILTIAELVIPNLKTTEEVRIVLSENLMSSIINGCHREDLAALSRKVCGCLLSLITAHKDTDSGIQLVVLERIIQAPGSVRFDKMTGTKTIQQSSEHLSTNTIKQLANILSSMIMDNTSAADLKITRQDKILSCQWLSKLTCHTKMAGSTNLSWRGKHLVTLMTPAFFMTDHPHNLHGYRDCFSRSLDQLCKNLDGYAALTRLVVKSGDEVYKKTRGKDKKDKEIRKSWDHIVQQLEVFEDTGKEQLPSEAINVFTVLYSHMGFMLFMNTDDAKEVIDELDQCYNDAVSRAIKKRKKKKKLNDSTSESPFWVDIVVDLLLSLLSKTNHNWRSVVQTVFKSLCPMLTSTAVSAVTDVLEPEKQDQVIEGKEEGGDDQDGDDRMVPSDSSDSDSDSSDEEEEEEEEEKGNGEEEKEDDDEEEEEEEDSDIEEEVKENEDNIFEMKKKMLSLVGHTDDGNDVDDVDMDSVPTEQLEQLDERLGALMGLFIKKKNKKNKKKKLAKDETQLMHFRTRVCDLVDVLLEECPSMSLVLQLITPLINSYKNASKDKLQEPLQNRLLSLLNKFGHVKKFVTTEDVTEDDLVNHMDELYNSNFKSGEFMTQIVGGCSTLFLHCGMIVMGEAVHNKGNKLVQTYHKHLDDFFKRKDIQLGLRAFSTPFTLDCGGLWSSAEVLANHSFDQSVRLFRRTQALEVVKMFFHNQMLLKRGDEDEKNKLMNTINANAVDVFNAIESTACVKSQYMLNLLDLLRVMKQESSNSINWDSLGKALVEFRSRITLREVKAIKNSLNKLFFILKLQSISQSKKPTLTSKKHTTIESKSSSEDEDSDEDNTKEEEEETSKSKKKKKKRTWTEQMEQEEKNKKKKARRKWLESKKRRLGSQKIDELENFSFASDAVNMDDSMGGDKKLNTKKRKKSDL